MVAAIHTKQTVNLQESHSDNLKQYKYPCSHPKIQTNETENKGILTI